MTKSVRGVHFNVVNIEAGNIKGAKSYRGGTAKPDHIKGAPNSHFELIRWLLNTKT